MGNFFRMDGPFMKYGSLVFDMIALSVIWTLTSGVGIGLYLFMFTTMIFDLPIIVSFLILFVLFAHWAPATCGLIYALGKKVRGTDSYAFRDYFHAYASNYKPCMIVSAVLTFVLLLILYNLWLISQNLVTFGNFGIVIYALEILVGVEDVFAMVYAAGLIARFEMPIKDYFKYMLVLANKHLPTTVLLVALLAGAIWLTCFYNLVLFGAVPAVYAMIAAVLLERVFKNYMPSEDDELEQEVEEEYELDAERQAIVERYLNQTSLNQETLMKARQEAEEAAEVSAEVSAEQSAE